MYLTEFGKITKLTVVHSMNLSLHTAVCELKADSRQLIFHLMMNSDLYLTPCLDDIASQLAGQRGHMSVRCFMSIHVQVPYRQASVIQAHSDVV